MSIRTAVLALLAALAPLTPVAAAEAPAVKPAEVSTVGTTPAVFSAADQAKRAEINRRLAAERMRPPVWRPAAPVMAVKPPEVSVREAAAAPRHREKPVPAATAPSPAVRP